MHIRTTHFNPSRPFDLQIATTNLSLKVDVADHFWLVSFSVTGPRERKENAFHFKFPNVGCSVIRAHAPGIFSIISKHTGASMDKNEPCFIPKGEYYMTEPVNMTFPYFPMMVYGRYRLHLQCRDAPKLPVKFCGYMDFEIIPRPG
ncbi:uncharacterized protein LOC117650771 [Thrips palmi]|uniref:Uncharacterized protein LOC117650771 n=1 Tax=Thrips palmi TaxID=161013 RepID=A0A6P8ZXX6_THRPL|nr:uncharacterized protein LOC117650771 [Thrips palmi]